MTAKQNHTPSTKVEPLRQVRVGATLQSKQVKTGGSPEEAQGSSNAQTPAWQFRSLDQQHPDWGWKNLQPNKWREVLQHLHDFEGMTWGDIIAQSGGRAHGTNHHPLPVDGLTKEAQDRLVELGHDDIDEVFSFRITNTLRLYGIREDRTLRIIWRDPHHGTKRACWLTRSAK